MRKFYLLLANVCVLHGFVFRQMRELILLQINLMIPVSVSPREKETLMLLNRSILELLIWIVLVSILAQRIRNWFKCFKTALTDAITKSSES